MNSKSITVAVALIVITSTMAAPAAAFFDTGTQTPDIARYGADANPSFVVELDNSSFASLQDWANSTSEREIISYHNASRTATVAAPRVHVDATILQRAAALPSQGLMVLTGDGMLASKSYVKSVAPNYETSYAEPVSNLTGESGYDKPDLTLRQDLTGQEVPTDGLAFSKDANRTTMQESRQILGADNVTATGSGVTVAVIDTGANTADGRVFGNGTAGSSLRISNASKNFITNGSVDTSTGDYSAIADGNGHGTWTAAAVAANTSNNSHDGFAPDANLLILKALADDGSGETADIASAIRYAADHNADVISLSLGSPVQSDALEDAIAYAHANGVTSITVAAGNSRQTTRWLASPADADGVIAVGAVNGSEAPTAASAYFSQIGPDPGTTDMSGGATQGATVDVAAPGMATVATVPTEDGTTTTEKLSGTSMATPMVAGSIAQALEANSSLVGQHELVHDSVSNTARPIPNAATAEVGSGMMAVDNLISGTQPATDQDEAMSSGASQRNTAYQGLSDASGGWLSLAGVRTEVFR